MLESMLKIKRDKIFVCLVGIPGSGKSTFVKKNLPSYTVISSDDIIEEAARLAGKTYNELWKDLAKDAEKQTKEIFRQAIAAGTNIVWDQTNVAVRKRASILSQIPKDYYKIAVHFTTPFDIIQERLIKREKETGKHIPLSVVVDMMTRLEVPTITEGFDEILLA